MPSTERCTSGARFVPTPNPDRWAQSGLGTTTRGGPAFSRTDELRQGATYLIHDGLGVPAGGSERFSFDQLSAAWLDRSILIRATLVEPAP
jgi:hypothetical protein